VFVKNSELCFFLPIKVPKSNFFYQKSSYPPAQKVPDPEQQHCQSTPNNSKVHFARGIIFLLDPFKIFFANINKNVVSHGVK
jgi:hypothetical protein